MNSRLATVALAALVLACGTSATFGQSVVDLLRVPSTPAASSPVSAAEKEAFDKCGQFAEYGAVTLWAVPTADAMRYMGKFDSLRTIRMRAFVGDVNELIAVFAASDSPVKGITAFALHGMPVTDAGLAALTAPGSALKNVRGISLTRSLITDAGLAHLTASTSPLTKLESLSLDETQITDAGITTLTHEGSTLHGLQTLSLRNTKVTDAGVATLARADTSLKALQSLRLAGLQITDASAHILAAKQTGLPALKSLSLSNSKLTDAGVAAITAVGRAGVGVAAETTGTTVGEGITHTALSARAAGRRTRAVGHCACRWSRCSVCAAVGYN